MTHINPLIFRILLYAIKNKYPRQRNSLSYWDDKECSRLDLAKRIYGGPFTTEQVEDMKIFSRMFRLLCVACAFLVISMCLGRATFLMPYRFPSHLSFLAADCVKLFSDSSFGYLLMMVCIPLWEVVLSPLFRKCLSKLRIHSRILLGAMLIFVTILSLICIYRIDPAAL